MANFLQGLAESSFFSSPNRAFRMSGWGRHSSPNALPTAAEKSHTNSLFHKHFMCNYREGGKKWCANGSIIWSGAPLASNAAIVASSCLHTTVCTGLYHLHMGHSAYTSSVSYPDSPSTLEGGSGYETSVSTELQHLYLFVLGKLPRTKRYKCSSSVIEYLQGLHHRGLVPPLRWSVQSRRTTQTSSLLPQCSPSCQLLPQSGNMWWVCV